MWTSSSVEDASMFVTVLVNCITSLLSPRDIMVQTIDNEWF